MSNLKPKIKTLSDKDNQVTASVDVNGIEYQITLSSEGLTTVERDRLIKKEAAEQAKGDL